MAKTTSEVYAKSYVEQYNLFGEVEVQTVVHKHIWDLAEEAYGKSPKDRFLLDLEKALGMKRILDQDGNEVLDQEGRPLRRVDRRVRRFAGGVYRAEKLGPMLRQMLPISCLNRARAAITPLFEGHENESLVADGLALLNQRLHTLQGDDCPKLITTCFMEFYAQQDVAMNERTGETFRNNLKKMNAEARRRAAGVAPRNWANNRTVDGAIAEEPVQEVERPRRTPLPTPIKLAVNVRPANDELEEALASDDTISWRAKKETSFLIEED